MNQLCVKDDKPCPHEQRLLRNVGVHTVVLDLLQIPYDQKDDVRMHKLMGLAHEFLQNFSLRNTNNQALLHKHLDLFLNPGVSTYVVYRVSGSCHKRQKPQAPTPQAPLRNRQTRKVANAKGLHRNTNLTQPNPT